MLECPLNRGSSNKDGRRMTFSGMHGMPLQGEEVLIQAPTGSGKTYAGLGAVLREGAERKRSVNE